MKKLTSLENRFEADFISEALSREGIRHVVRTFEDSAYDGLFVTQKGFGLILVEEEDLGQAEEIVKDIRAAVEAFPPEPLDDEPEETDKPDEPEEPSPES
ncbi:MAG: DUF2007 domain-containing protein [Pseudomonadota bacterium]